MKRTLKIGITALAALTAASLFVTKNTSVQADSQTPQDLITDYVTRYYKGEIKGLYDESLKVEHHLNSEEDYAAALDAVYKGVTNYQYKTVKEDDSVREYALYDSDGNRICRLRSLLQSDGTWATATIFNNEKEYTIEVPAGLSLKLNGEIIPSDYETESDAAADNFSGMDDTSQAPRVDVYVLQGMLKEPQVTVEEHDNYGSILDVTSNTIYVGEDVTDDSELSDMLIRDAQICAQFPAQETGVGSVGAISITASDWYRRVSGVQNQWFTAHGNSQFSNQKASKIIRQADDALIADVSFDYYASNGQVSRTWNCGYQMTMLNVSGTWKIAGMGVDSLLNPNAKNYQTNQ